MVLGILHKDDALFYGKVDMLPKTFEEYLASPSTINVKHKSSKYTSYISSTEEDFNNDNTSNHNSEYILMSSLLDDDYSTFRENRIRTLSRSFQIVTKDMEPLIYNHYMGQTNGEQPARDKATYDLCRGYIDDGDNVEVMTRYGDIYGLSATEFANALVDQYDLIHNNITLTLSAVKYVERYFNNQITNGIVKDISGVVNKMREEVSDHIEMMDECKTILDNNVTVESLPPLLELPTTIGG